MKKTANDRTKPSNRTAILVASDHALRLVAGGRPGTPLPAGPDDVNPQPSSLLLGGTPLPA